MTADTGDFRRSAQEEKNRQRELFRLTTRGLMGDTFSFPVPLNSGRLTIREAIRQSLGLVCGLESC
jgi:hypothetical protein